MWRRRCRWSAYPLAQHGSLLLSQSKYRGSCSPVDNTKRIQTERMVGRRYCTKIERAAPLRLRTCCRPRWGQKISSPKPRDGVTFSFSSSWPRSIQRTVAMRLPVGIYRLFSFLEQIQSSYSTPAARKLHLSSADDWFANAIFLDCIIST